MDFKVGQKVLIKGWSLTPKEGDLFIIASFNYPKTYALIKNVEDGHIGRNEGYSFDENQIDIGVVQDGSDQYWYILYSDLIDPNNLDDIMKNKEHIPQSILEKLGL